MRRLVVDLNSSVPHMRAPAWATERLLKSAPEGWEVVVVGSPTISVGDGTNRVSEETLREIGAAEAYFGYGVPPALLEAAPGLRWAHSASAGITGSLTPTLRSSGVVFTNSAGVFAESMADSALAGVTYFVRGLDIATRLQRLAEWTHLPFLAPEAHMRELADCRVLILGAGGVGSAVARRFAAMGCECVGIRRRPELGVPPGFARITGFDALEHELPQGDILVLSAPLTADTRQVLNRARLALLPSGAIVVNVARGAMLDEGALLAALDAGRVRGAWLDVFESEPLSPTSALWGHPRVLVTPHISGVSPLRHWRRALDLFEDNWRRWIAGSPLHNVVDADAGY